MSRTDGARSNIRSCRAAWLGCALASAVSVVAARVSFRRAGARRRTRVMRFAAAARSPRKPFGVNAGRYGANTRSLPASEVAGVVTLGVGNQLQA